MCNEQSEVKAHCLLLNSQESHHGGRTDTAKYAEDGDGHPGHDEQDKGEHVGEAVTIKCHLLVMVTRPVAKHIDVSDDEPTEIKYVG